MQLKNAKRHYDHLIKEWSIESLEKGIEGVFIFQANFQIIADPKHGEKA